MSTATLERPALPRESDLRELLKLALPIIGMTVSRMMMGFIDFFMVSKLGTEATAAISPATLFVFAAACLGMGAATSVQTFVSQAEGRGQPREAGGYIWQIFYIAAAFLVLTIPFAITTETWFTWIMHAGNMPPRVGALALDYIAISLWSVPFAVLCAGLNGFFNGVQKPRIPLIATFISLVVNVIGNYLLIYGTFGFPQMGIAGAAVATVISWAVRAGLMTWALLLRQFDERFNTRHSTSLDWHKMGGIWRVGAPTAIQWVVDIGAWVVFLNVIMPYYGEVAMAASNVALQYMHLSFMPAIGIGMALCSQVGFAIGEQQPDRAVRKARVAFGVTAAYMGAIGLLFLAAGEPLMRFFSADPEVIKLGRVVLIWAAVFQIFDAMGISYMNSLRGAGDTRWPAVVVFICCWFVFVAGGYASRFVAPAWGIHGPWLACTVYISALGVALWLRWRGGKWRSIKLFKERPEQAAGPPPRPEGPRPQPTDELECGVPDPATGTFEPASSVRSPE